MGEGGEVMKTAHPPWNGTCEGAWAKGQDFMTHAGAMKLAAMIRAAWKRVGIDIQVEVICPTGRIDGVWVVRMPDLVRGLHV